MTENLKNINNQEEQGSQNLHHERKAASDSLT